MNIEPRESRFLLARASLGLTSRIVTSTLEFPGRAIRAGLHLPAAVVGAGARRYLQLTHLVNDLAQEGDAVIEALIPRRETQPSWATFDEDATSSDEESDDVGSDAERVTDTANVAATATAPTATAPPAEGFVDYSVDYTTPSTFAADFADEVESYEGLESEGPERDEV